MSFSCLYFCQPIGKGLLFFHSTVNVFELFTRVQQLGGYEAVGEKKLWKQLYEELSGSSSSSHPPQSAQSYASMMKRHYERYIFLSICTYCMIPLCLSSYLREGSMNQPENAQKDKASNITCDASYQKEAMMLELTWGHEASTLCYH